jgi:hypothetical protein
MKSLALIAAIACTVGAAALSGCSSCSPSANKNTPAAPAVTCGPGTVAQGSQCVGAVNR